jgi:hypothetical protein
VFEHPTSAAILVTMTVSLIISQDSGVRLLLKTNPKLVYYFTLPPTLQTPDTIGLSLKDLIEFNKKGYFHIRRGGTLV